MPSQEPSVFGEAYTAKALDLQSRRETPRHSELTQLRDLAEEYGPVLRESLEHEAGPDADGLTQELDAVIKARDDDERSRREKELRRRYGRLMKRVVSASGIDRQAVRRKLLATIEQHETRPELSEADRASLADMDLVDTESLGFSLVARPKSLEPSPLPIVRSLMPPYGFVLVSTSDSYYAQVNPATGAMWAASVSFLAGSFETRAAVGTTFEADPTAGRVRVEVTPEVSYGAQAAASLLYASAEAKLNLIVSDPQLREISSDRRSLARSIALVLWYAAVRKDDPVPVALACEFEKPLGQSVTYLARVEAEAWAGGVDGSASSWDYVRGIQNFTIRTDS